MEILEIQVHQRVASANIYFQSKSVVCVPNVAQSRIFFTKREFNTLRGVYENFKPPSLKFKTGSSATRYWKSFLPDSLINLY